MATDRNCQFTDTMIKVARLEDEKRFWVDVIGMVELQESQGVVVLEDPESEQRVTLVSTDFGGRYAMAVATDNLQVMLANLRKNGADVLSPKKTEAGLEYALCKTPSGIPIMVYETE